MPAVPRLNQRVRIGEYPPGYISANKVPYNVFSEIEPDALMFRVSNYWPRNNSSEPLQRKDSKSWHEVLRWYIFTAP